MGLTDPEIELLLEALEEDPGDDVYLRVGEELIRRSKWADAARILAAGLQAEPIPDAWVLLARARLELSDPEAALKAVRMSSPELRESPEGARIEMLALERTGKLDDARRIATALLESSRDIVAQALLERLDAPQPEGPVVSPDPWATAAFAERFAEISRFDRAIRLYRRLVFHNPQHRSLQVRLRELMNGHPDADEFTRDSTTEAPPDLPMAPLEVVPRLGPTPVPVERTARPSDPPTLPPEAIEADDEDTDVSGSPQPVSQSPDSRRRRRSLLNP